MDRKDLIIGVHAAQPGDEDANDLVKAFEANGVKAMLYTQCLTKNIEPHLTIGYDSAGLPHWQKILNKGIINILWSKDSAFSQNINIIRQFATFKNFVVFTSTPCDTEPLAAFFPNLKQGYLPLGYAAYPQELPKKEYDLVFYGDILDVETRMDELSQKMPEFVFKLMCDINTILIQNPTLSFWQVYTIFRDSIGLEVDLEQYILLFSAMIDLITSQKQLQMMDALKDFEIKVFGNDAWKKYVEGKHKYMGHGDKSVLAKTKIALNAHPMDMSLGLSAYELEAAATKAFVISSQTKSLELEFGDNMAYYNYSDFSDLKDKVAYFLKNEKERAEKAQKAFDILNDRNTLEKRAAEILKIIDF